MPNLPTYITIVNNFCGLPPRERPIEYSLKRRDPVDDPQPNGLFRPELRACTKVRQRPVRLADAILRHGSIRSKGELTRPFKHVAEPTHVSARQVGWARSKNDPTRSGVPKTGNPIDTQGVS